MAALLCLTLAGCADNALLEVELTLPPATACERFARVEAISVPPSQAVEFTADWGAGAQVVAAPLGAPDARTAVSLEASGDKIERTVLIRARLCAQPACDGPVADGCSGDAFARALFVAVERGFYAGEYTQIAIDLAAAKASPQQSDVVVFGRCDVAGCAQGAAASYCFEGGQHFCE